jgi:23S rRNA pseudouridine2604 synthase
MRVGPATFRIILTQGLNRQIRRMCSFFGYKVLRLQRVRIINLTLEGLGLKSGKWRELKENEVRGLLPHKPEFNF